MPRYVLKLIFLLVPLLSPYTALGSELDWMKDLNIRAEASNDGLKLYIAKHFKINGVDVDIVWTNTDSPADAYNVSILSEWSGRPVKEVLMEYNKDQGWGVLAKNLGIKPGSAAFHAMKGGQKGQPLYYEVADNGDPKKKNKTKGTLVNEQHSSKSTRWHFHSLWSCGFRVWRV